MSDEKTWLAAQIAQARPVGREVAGYQERVVALAQAVAALEGRHSAAFGLHLSSPLRAACAPLIEDAREALLAWRRSLHDAHGDEGSDFVDGVTLDCGFRIVPAKKLRHEPLGALEHLDPSQRRAVERFEEALERPSSLTPAWDDADQLIEPDDRVQVWLGEPDEAKLRRMAERYERIFDAGFPVDLAYVLARTNGVALTSDPDGGRHTVPAVEVGEPQLWGAEVSGDHHLLRGVEAMPHRSLYTIGELPDAGYLCLAVARGEGRPPVVWVHSDLSSQPHRLGDDFDRFLEAWVDAALCLPLLLQRRRVPGWG